MKVIAKICPNCQAPLDDASRFCSHCGTSVVTDDEASRMKYTYQKVDDARIREADVREKIRIKELEIELLKLKNESEQRKSFLKIKFCVLLGLLAILALLILAIAFLKENDIQPAFWLLAIIMMIVIAIVIPKIFKTNS